MDPSTRLAFFRPQTNVTDMRLEKRFAVIVVNCMTVPDPPIRNLQCIPLAKARCSTSHVEKKCASYSGILAAP